MSKFVTIGKSKFMIRKGNSIFVTRNGKQDISICVKGSYGGRAGEGEYYGLYSLARIMDAETGEIIRDYEFVPPELTFKKVLEMGIDR